MEGLPNQEKNIEVKFGGSQNSIIGTIDGQEVRVGIDHGGFGPNPEKFYGTLGGRELSEVEAEDLYNELKPAAEATPWEPTELPEQAA